MARYTGPRTRLSRRLGVPLFGPSKYLERRNYPPGVHGPKSRRKLSDYALGLAEKQKLRFQYGLMERQFRRMYEMALKQRGVTGETLLQLLERRLDNVVYRLGFATTRAAARQMVSHGHVLVNGRKVNVPSFQVKVGDIIEIKNNVRSQNMARTSLESAQVRMAPEWLVLDRDNLRGQVSRLPTMDDIQPIVNPQLIVEFYSR
ncbi:MAG: 30S ribosomal protein S4 [Verrucomicrobiae bacterium]|nr:30S ribosomal protein S4 [Verrucomicrobiae bacterium]